MRARQMACAALLALLWVATARGDLVHAWKLLGDSRAAKALPEFEREMNAPDPAIAREAKFGKAVTLLDRQPTTRAQIAEAQGLFESLADGKGDDVADGSRFFLGRIAQHHLQEPNPGEAAKQYRRLLQERPDSRWAQSAITPLAYLEIYELNRNQTPRERLANAEKLESFVRVPAAESDLNLAIADAVFHYRLPAIMALPHLVTAEKQGLLDLMTRSDVLTQIGVIATESGDNATALSAFKAFLQANPLDQRHYMVKARIAELEARLKK